MNSSPPKDDGKPTAMPLDWFEGQPTMERSAWFAEDSLQMQAYFKLVMLCSHAKDDRIICTQEMTTCAAAYAASLKYEKHCEEKGEPKDKGQKALIAELVNPLIDLEFDPEGKGENEVPRSVMKMNARWQALDALMMKKKHEKREKEKNLAEKAEKKDSK